MKSFGSKNDWKRHESSQHYQLETWRCNEPDVKSRINQCAKLYYRREEFQDHLRIDHKREDEKYLHEQCKMCRIGRNGQTGFWCGFCLQIVKLESRGLEAWDERFDHINDHFTKNQLKITAWFPIDKDIPKGDLLMDNANHNGVSGAIDDSDSDHNDVDDNWRQVPRRRRPPPPPPPPPPAPDNSADDAPAVSAPLHYSFPSPHPPVLQEQPSNGSRVNAMVYQATDSYKKHPPRSWFCVSSSPMRKMLVGWG